MNHPITDLAGIVSGWKPDQIPVRFQQQIKLSILDTMAVSLAAQPLPDVRQMVALYVRQASGQGRIWWNGAMVSPLDAAFVNAYASHRMDFDNILYSTFGHPSIMLLPALFALYDTMEFSGRDLIHATMIGLETMSVLGMSFGWNLKMRNFHPTPVLGALSTTAAVGWLLNFSEQQMKSALTLSGSMIGGFKSSFGLPAKPYQVGVATRDALAAALMAHEAPDLAMEEKWVDNLMLLSGVERENWDNRTFGEPWVLDQFTFLFKYYPCCGYFHHSMNGLSRILRESGRDRNELRKVRLVLPQVIKDASVYERPTTFNESQFSVEFNLGLVLAYGEAKLEHFTEEQVHAESVIRAMELLEFEYLPNESTLNAEGLMTGQVTLHLADGSTYQAQMVLSDYGAGSEVESLVEKYLQCAASKLTDDQTSAFLEWVMNLEQTDAKDWRRLQKQLSYSK